MEYKTTSPKTRTAARTAAFGGVLAALVLIATSIVKIPLPSGMGYFNLGDATIFVSALILGPFAAFPAAIGSALADFLSPYAVYAPGTLIIKGLMGLVAGLLLKRSAQPSFKLALPTLVLMEVIMVAGYFIFEMILSGTPVAAAGTLIGNGLQALAAIVLSLVLLPVINRVRPQIKPL